MSTASQLRRSPLYEKQRDAGARFLAQGDWEMLDSFGSPDAEYEALSSTVGIVDLCHEGRFKLEGADAEACLDHLACIDVSQIAVNTERVCYLLNERGGIIDEVGILRSDRFWSIHCSAPRRERVWKWLEAAGDEFADIELSDATTTQGSVAVIGPLAVELMRDGIMDGKVPAEEGASSILQIGQGRCLVTRRHFGGQPCFHIDSGGLFIESVWERLCNLAGRRDGMPVGFRALEMVRVEAAQPRVGAEIDEDTTPIEIGRMLKVEFTKPDFVGRQPLLHSTCGEFTRRLVFLRIEGLDVPHPGDPVETDGVPVGYVTSAASSPRVKCALAMAYVDSFKTAPNTTLSIRTQHNTTLLASVTDSESAKSR
ncbi:MAG: aminomethyltransferase [Candidatus Sumerlaeota bacterium]|nr:aminomethyltransferase [Candidatus Sumerlaeota bacterium]